MITIYAALLRLAGLSHREASEFHTVRPDTVKSWSAGRNNAPPGVIAEIIGLIRRQAVAAQESAAEIERVLAAHGAPEVIEMGLAADDYEAQGLGWPCVGAHGAVLARVAALIGDKIPIKIVPRGGTAATAAAADTHDQALE